MTRESQQSSYFVSARCHRNNKILPCGWHDHSVQHPVLVAGCRMFTNLPLACIYAVYILELDLYCRPGIQLLLFMMPSWHHVPLYQTKSMTGWATESHEKVLEFTKKHCEHALSCHGTHRIYKPTEWYHFIHFSSATKIVCQFSPHVNKYWNTFRIYVYYFDRGSPLFVVFVMGGMEQIDV